MLYFCRYLAAAAIYDSAIIFTSFNSVFLNKHASQHPRNSSMLRQPKIHSQINLTMVYNTLYTPLLTQGSVISLFTSKHTEIYYSPWEILNKYTHDSDNNRLSAIICHILYLITPLVRALTDYVLACYIYEEDEIIFIELTCFGVYMYRRDAHVCGRGLR